MNFADRLKKRERYSHVRENEHGMTLIEYMTVNFPRFNRCEWLEKIKAATAEQLTGVDGITEKLAENIYQYFH